MDLLSARIAAFIKIRDIPYHVSVQGEPDFCCSSKATLLQSELAVLGIESRPVIVRFSWRSLSLPASVLQYEHQELETHQYLEVRIPESGQWVEVDPTWDAGLAPLFSISSWDGLHDTRLAVESLGRLSAEEAAAVICEEANPAAAAEYMRKYGAFLTALNQYIRESRK